MKKKEFLIIGSIVIFAIILWIGMTVTKTGSREMVRITIDGQEYGTWPLDEDQVIEIADTNVCEIKDGEAFMSKASCPDHLCMKQAPVGKNGGMIVCLPNKVIIEGTGGSAGTDNPSVDAVG